MLFVTASLFGSFLFDNNVNSIHSSDNNDDDDDDDDDDSSMLVMTLIGSVVVAFQSTLRHGSSRCKGAMRVSVTSNTVDRPRGTTERLSRKLRQNRNSTTLWFNY